MRKTQRLPKIALVIACSFLEQNQMKGQKGDPQKVKVEKYFWFTRRLADCGCRLIRKIA